MRRRLLVIPAVSDLGSFSRLIAHLGHHFGHVDAERIAVLVAPTLVREAREWLRSPSLPPAFGDRVVARIEAVRARVTLTAWPRNLEALLLAGDLVLDWDVRGSGVEPWASIKARYRPDKTLFSVDWQGTPCSPAGLAEAARVLAEGRSFDRSQSQSFGDLIERLGRPERAYLVGGGPSARTALDLDLSDGLRVICDSAILDDELVAHVRPHVLTVADPILHFGPSSYAQRFLEAVVDQGWKHDFSVVTTERYASLLRALAPEIAGRVIGLREGTADWPDTFDLHAHPAVRPYPDVLTMLMLPIAATMARSIGLIGFDGRDPRAGDAWRLESPVRFQQEFEDLRLVHPGWFELGGGIEYDDSIATMERVFASLEERDVEIRPMAASSIPALRRRSVATFRASPVMAGETRPMLVSLTPDWIGDFGHYGPFERRVHKVAEATGYAHVALASAGLHATAHWQARTFSEPTVSAGGRFAPVGRSFERELRDALEHLRPGPGAVVFLYTADVWHLPAILGEAVNHPEARFVVNLMRSHGWIERALDGPDPWIEGLVDLLRACLAVASRINVDVAVDTEALARDVERLTGQPVVLWPMITVSVPPQRHPDRPAADGGPHVVAPVQAQGAKGFPDLVALAERVKGRLERGELRLTARWPADGTSPQLLGLAERFEEHGGRLVRDNLTDEAFVDLVASADVALIPYRVRPFRTRTSAVALDALLAGKPLVAVRGTWAGDLVERYRAGLTYADGDVEEMDGAISEVISDLDAYRSRVAAIRGVIAAEHAPERLIQFLRGARSSPGPDAQARISIEAVRERADRMRKLYRWHLVAEDSVRISAVIHEDDQQRIIDSLRDDVDGLKRAIAYRDRARAHADASPGPERPGSARVHDERA